MQSLLLSPSSRFPHKHAAGASPHQMSHKSRKAITPRAGFGNPSCQEPLSHWVAHRRGTALLPAPHRWPLISSPHHIHPRMSSCRPEDQLLFTAGFRKPSHGNALALDSTAQISRHPPWAAIVRLLVEQRAHPVALTTSNIIAWGETKANSFL